MKESAQRIEVGDKIIGFEPRDKTRYMNFMDTLIGNIGTVLSVDDSEKPYIRVEFDYRYRSTFGGTTINVAYPLEEAIGHLYVPDYTFYSEYIGRKMRAFNFPTEYKGISYSDDMENKYHSFEVGEICEVLNEPNLPYAFHVRFKDGSGWSYPCELAIPHIINIDDNSEPDIERAVRNWEAEHVEQVKPDMVNSPAHYGTGVYELCNVLEAYGFQNELWLGQALQYIVRYNKKGHTTDSMIEDLEKAIWNIKRKIKLLKESE